MYVMKEQREGENGAAASAQKKTAVKVSARVSYNDSRATLEGMGIDVDSPKR